MSQVNFLFQFKLYITVIKLISLRVKLSVYDKISILTVFPQPLEGINHKSDNKIKYP